MPNEPDDFLSKVETISRNWVGSEWSPDRAVADFPLYEFADRARFLDDFDAELNKPDVASNLRRYSELVGVRRRLDVMHHQMRKAGR
jgi:hypothetical protein